MKKKYIKPATVVIVTRLGQLLADSLPPGLGHGAAKENVFFNNGEDDDGTDNTGWVRAGSNVWDE